MHELVKITWHPFGSCKRDRKDFLDVPPQFAASAEKHEGVLRVNASNKLPKLTEGISIQCGETTNSRRLIS